MVTISKSHYLKFLQCPAGLWLSVYKPELGIVDSSAEQRFETGHLLGEYAKRIIYGTIDVLSFKQDGKLDIAEMIKKTQKAISDPVPAIAEASFSIDNMFASIDILKNNFDGTWDIYEVKSSSEVKNVYLYDVAFQKHVLQKFGLQIKNSFIVYLNKDYVKNGEIEVGKIFLFYRTDELIVKHLSEIDDNAKKAIEILESKTEPNIPLHNCNKPYPCPFFEYHISHLTKPNIFDLYRLNMEKKLQFYYNNLRSFEDLQKSHHTFNEIQQRQIEWTINGQGTYINKDGIKGFLKKIKFPLYFLDFETIESVVPVFDGTYPNQKIVYQYSLHVMTKDSDDLKHFEYLAEHNIDPRRQVAEGLIKDIKNDGGSIIVYNKSFEMSRIKELANDFPDLKVDLLALNKRVVDLLDVFTKGYVYHKDMGGSFSIKKTLPVLYPNEAGLNYKNLKNVQNGMDAQKVFSGLANNSEEERKMLRQNLLDYCELDTYAMVMIYMKLLKNINT